MATGHRKLLEQLSADGITRIFGNPGSTEEGLLDVISKFGEIEYVMGLQEAALVLMASGYAQATQKPTAVQLHCSVGLGNALGSLYHVCRMQRSPLIVLAGEAGIEYDALDAHMALDLVTLVRPVTKYAARVTHPGSLLRLVRRCVKMAATPPVGPVFLAVPQDILDQPNDEPVLPTVVLDTRVTPEPALIARAAELLAGAEDPVIVMGDGIAHARAQGELARLAEVLGAEVWGAMASELNIPWTHPLYRGSTGHMFGQVSRQTVAQADAVVICGTYVFPDVFPLLENPFRPDAKVIHIDLDAYDIAKNHPVTLGLVSDPKPTLRLLANAVADRLSPGQRQAVRDRAERSAREKQQQVAADVERDRANRRAVPLHMSAFAEELAKQLPEGAIIYDESITYSTELTRWVPPPTSGGFFQTPGGTLGVGIPGAVGVKLAHPDRTVVGFTGDGGAMFTYQALWTAAHYRIGAKFVVCDNESYRILKQNIVTYWNDRGQQTDQAFPPSFDVCGPDVDFVSLARGLGVPGCRVSQPAQTAAAITTMLEHDGPYLVELVLERDVSRTPAYPRAS
ncbi:MAG: thiamine pyrophosphate-binding protein [Mycolicibacterium sp.]|nr:thiamine pyrophosphate-binding protein [Mycolicibacterium sp.]